MSICLLCFGYIRHYNIGAVCRRISWSSILLGGISSRLSAQYVVEFPGLPYFWGYFIKIIGAVCCRIPWSSIFLKVFHQDCRISWSSILLGGISSRLSAQYVVEFPGLPYFWGVFHQDYRRSMLSNFLVFHTSGGISSSPAALTRKAIIVINFSYWKQLVRLVFEKYNAY